jgi:hypothetical protein
VPIKAQKQVLLIVVSTRAFVQTLDRTAWRLLHHDTMSAWSTASIESMPIHLALHGLVALLASFVAGLLLHRSIRLRRPGAEAWHLAHAGGSTRGILLMALAGVWPRLGLPAGANELAAALWLFFVWTSTAAMLIAAATGHRGLTWSGGTAIDRTVFALYVAGTVAVFPAALLVMAGFLGVL